MDWFLPLSSEEVRKRKEAQNDYLGHMDNIVCHDDCDSNNRNLAVVYNSNSIMVSHVIHNPNDMGGKQRLKANWDVLVPFSFSHKIIFL